ncbi:MAG TPA: methyl-accepting chemotaxis protein [Bacillota bacterium]|nr:methyl-accepting chemotaxis protein [Bacillota bacterium]
MRLPTFFNQARKSISVKLSIVMVMVITVSFSITGYLIYLHTSNYLQKELEESLLTKSSAIADQVSSLFNEKGTIVRNMGSNQDMINFLRTAHTRDEVLSNPYYKDTANALDSIFANDKSLSFVWIVSSEGSFYIGNKGSISKLDYNIKQRPWYADAVKVADLSYSEPYVDAETGKLVVSILHPIKDNDRLLGFVACDVFLDSLPQIMSSYKFGQTGYTVLLAKDGTIMYHPNKEYVMKNKLQEMDGGLSSLWGKMETNEKSLELINDHGTWFYTGYSPISLTGWKVAALIPKSEALSGLNSLATSIIQYFLISLLLLVSVVYFLLRYMLRNIPKILENIKQLSTGDLTRCFQVDSEDEIGQVAINLNVMTDSLEAMFNQVRLASEHTVASSEALNAVASQSVSASNHIFEGIQAVVSEAEIQLESTEQTSQAMEEMSVGVQRVAETASILSGLVHTSLEKIEQGNLAVKEALSEIHSINDSVKRTSHEMQLLHQNSESISEVISVITEISAQTQLLSLNASIEAARAGEQGRGFGVVANEVKKLAEQSRASAEHIANRIRDVLQSTDYAMKTMSQSVIDVEHGAKVINAVSEVFNDVSQTFHLINDQTQDASSVAEQMAAGSEQVAASVINIAGNTKTSVRHIQEIKDVTKSQLESMREISNSADSLSKMAEQLASSLSQFKTKRQQ